MENAGFDTDARCYVTATNHLRGDLPALLLATQAWVTLDFEVDQPAKATPPPPTPAAPLAAPSSPPEVPPSDPMPAHSSAHSEEQLSRDEIAESLRQLKALHGEGILTDDEYETKRQRLARQL
jgi:hypothetical protein